MIFITYCKSEIILTEKVKKQNPMALCSRPVVFHQAGVQLFPPCQV